jgi:ribosomal protein S27E
MEPAVSRHKLLAKPHLDELRCAHCGKRGTAEHPIALTPKCHPIAHVDVVYANAVLIVTCSECTEEVCRILPAAGV